MSALESIKSVTSFFICLVMLICVASSFSWAQKTLPNAVPEIFNLRVGAHADKTRLVLDMDRKIAITPFYLLDPYRLVLDMPKVRFKINSTGLVRPVGDVSGYRFGSFDTNTSRVVVDLSKPMVIKKLFQLSGTNNSFARLVVDLKPVNESIFRIKSATSIHERQKKRTPNTFSEAKLESKSLSKKEVDRKIIIIDPGHGGVDPGAIGHAGSYEKNLVLSTAIVFKSVIEKDPAYKVVLTRTRDQFLPLRKRISRSKLLNADLFISIHADSISNSSVRGATIYTLSETASDKEAAQLAERENKADIISGMDLSDETKEVTNILIDLAQRETMNQSAKFAGLLVPELKKVIKTHRRPHKFAGFAVLKAPDVPSILLEMGYLSNLNEERLLKTDGFKKKLAASIKRGLDRYFDPD
jgi:N-acetylmuramoyl-L-alanine amidase